jgi:hypothetical protein
MYSKSELRLYYTGNAEGIQNKYQPEYSESRQDSNLKFVCLVIRTHLSEFYQGAPFFTLYLFHGPSYVSNSYGDNSLEAILGIVRCSLFVVPWQQAAWSLLKGDWISSVMSK